MYLSWIILGVLIVIVVLLLEFKDIKHRLFFFAMAGLIVFVLATFIYVAFKGNADFTSFEGFVGAGKLYFAWLDGFFGNMGKISAYAVNQNWGDVASNATG